MAAVDKGESIQTAAIKSNIATMFNSFSCNSFGINHALL